MKTVDLFNLYMGEPRPGPSAERKIGELTVRLTDDYDAKVAQLAKPASLVSDGTEVKLLSSHEGTWQATATVSYQDFQEKSVLLHEKGDDGGLWDLCTLLTFLTGRRVVTTEYKRRYRPDSYGDYAVVDFETLKAASLAWQHRNCLVSKNLHTALLLYNEAMEVNLLQSRATLYYTALDIILSKPDNLILDNHETTYQKVDKNIRDKLKEAISNVFDCFAKTEDFQPDQAERYRHSLDNWIKDEPTFTDKLFSLLQSLDIIDSPPTSKQKVRVKLVGRVRNRLVHSGRLKIKGLDDEQSKIHTIKIATEVVPEIIRIVIGHHLGFRSGGTGSHCQIADDLKNFFHNGVFRGQEFEQLAEDVLKKNEELYRRLS